MDPARTRLEHLLADHAVMRLSPGASAELDHLLELHPTADRHAFEHAAAAIHLYAVEPTHAPSGLEGRLEREADTYFSGHRLAAPSRRPTPRRSTFPVWALAAAACVIAAIGWWAALAPPPATTTGGSSRVGLATAQATPLALTATEDPAALGAGGELTWSDELQSGSMLIAGLAANDPECEQYQLWIFDAARDERFPVDGGVFDVPPGASRVVVPIDAKLRVTRATLFAITVEPPGGVVVSDRERIVLVARPATA